jgi:DNA recombination protein RmuC
MPTNYLIFIIILLGIFLAVIAALVLLWRSASRSQRENPLGLLQQQISDSALRQDNRLAAMSEQLAQAIGHLTAQMNDRLNQNQQLSQQTQQAIADRLDRAGKTMTELHQQLGRLGQAADGIQQVGGEIRKLQDILQSPKLRGGLGEWSLENLLADVLPKEHFQLQYPFRSGQKVDALVELTQGRVSIDAKFPLGNFQVMLNAPDDAARQKARREFLRDIRHRIDEVADKYIVPQEGTLDFALMYVPAENVYYETIRGESDPADDLGVYARRRHVMLVSPNTLYAYLMVIAMGLKGLKIEKNAQMIRQHLSQLITSLELFENDFITVGKHLTNAKAKYDDAARKIEQFNSRLRQIESHSEEEEN